MQQPRRCANEQLVGTSGYEAELATPALLLDLDAFEANLAAMAAIVARGGRQLRPHCKAHKSSRIARQQLEAGAVGLCCATVREAETMASAGLSGVLVTATVIAPAMVRRLVAAREMIDDLAVVVDSEAGVDVVAALASQERPVGVLVEIDMGQGRTGVIRPEDAVHLARRAASRPSLRYRGVQAYYGHLQHVPTLGERRARMGEGWARLATFLDALRAAGLEAEIVSGSGTGTHHPDAEAGPFTEIQAGSYLFMDKQYGAVELAPGGPPFRTALTIAARVVSAAQPDRVIIDAGLKAMATEAGPAIVSSGAQGDATYEFKGDEHGALRFPEGTARPQLGDLVTLVVPHCDPTVNLHDWLHIVRQERLIDIWPIDARGY